MGADPPKRPHVLRRRSGRARTRHPKGPAERLDCFALLAMTAVRAVLRSSFTTLELRSCDGAKSQHGAPAQRVRQQLLKPGGEIERPGKGDDSFSMPKPPSDASRSIFDADKKWLCAIE